MAIENPNRTRIITDDLTLIQEFKGLWDFHYVKEEI
jgi:hypothetical protein